MEQQLKRVHFNFQKIIKYILNTYQFHYRIVLMLEELNK